MPWWQEATRRDPGRTLSSCEKCMQINDAQTRQTYRCGYEPIPVGALARSVQVPTLDGYKGCAPTTCPGYTTTLPEVIEIARARLHWSKGNGAWFADDPMHPVAMGVEILEGAANECQSYWMTPKSKGGGAEG